VRVVGVEFRELPGERTFHDPVSNRCTLRFNLSEVDFQAFGSRLSVHFTACNLKPDQQLLFIFDDPGLRRFDAHVVRRTNSGVFDAHTERKRNRLFD